MKSEDFRLRKTENGVVKGLTYDPSDPRSFNQIGPYDNNVAHNATLFFGIPYAAPPVGKNRFRGPKNVENWDGILETYTKKVNAYYFSVMCFFNTKINIENLLTP